MGVVLGCWGRVVFGTLCDPIGELSELFWRDTHGCDFGRPFWQRPDRPLVKSLGEQDAQRIAQSVQCEWEAIAGGGILHETEHGSQE